MKLNKQEQDGEEDISIITQDNINIDNSKNLPKKKDFCSKKKLIQIFILIVFVLFVFYLKIELSRTTHKRKIDIGIVYSSFFGNGIGRFITILIELLAKTGKYDIYLTFYY